VGVQLHMQGSPAPAGCPIGAHTSETFFPCAQKQGNLTVSVAANGCHANFTLPTPSVKTYTHIKQQQQQQQRCHCAAHWARLLLCLCAFARLTCRDPLKTRITLSEE
jgi:hypothetical protein